MVQSYPNGKWFSHIPRKSGSFISQGKVVRSYPKEKWFGHIPRENGSVISQKKVVVIFQAKLLQSYLFKAKLVRSYSGNNLPLRTRRHSDALSGGPFLKGTCFLLHRSATSGHGWKLEPQMYIKNKTELSPYLSDGLSDGFV